MIPNVFGVRPGASQDSAQGQTRRSFLVNSGRAMAIGGGIAIGFGHAPIVRAARLGAASQATIAMAPNPCHASTYATVAQGFFRDEGLDVTVMKVTGGLALIANGTVDAGVDTFWSVIPPRLAPGRTLGDLVLTAGLQRGCIALSVPWDSEVQSFGDLRGQRVAGSKFLFAASIAEAGVDPDQDITWSPSPAVEDVFATLQTGEFGAVSSANSQAALLEVVGAARMLMVNNSPPSQNHYCCGSIMLASMVRTDPSKAAAITRAMMRGSAWAEAHRSETAELMRASITVPPAQREITHEDMEAALAMQEFVPMAESARPLLVQQFDEYLSYGLPVVESPMDAVRLVDRIYRPVTSELEA
jgi:NitT/TauT family transport system substrate-binding protein